MFPSEPRRHNEGGWNGTSSHHNGDISGIVFLGRTEIQSPVCEVYLSCSASHVWAWWIYSAFYLLFVHSIEMGVFVGGQATTPSRKPPPPYKNSVSFGPVHNLFTRSQVGQTFHVRPLSGEDSRVTQWTDEVLQPHWTGHLTVTLTLVSGLGYPNQTEAKFYFTAV